VQANALAEYYDLFRTFASLLEELIESDQTSYRVDDDDPMNRWYTEVQNVVFGSGLTDEAPSYGQQQGSRNTHKMEEYRRAYGDGNQVTDYQCVPAERLGDVDDFEVFIREHITESGEEVYLPIAPQTEMALPIVVDSEEELVAAVRLLEESLQNQHLLLTDQMKRGQMKKTNRRTLRRVLEVRRRLETTVARNQMNRTGVLHPILNQINRYFGTGTST